MLENLQFTDTLELKKSSKKIILFFGNSNPGWAPYKNNFLKLNSIVYVNIKSDFSANV